MRTRVAIIGGGPAGLLLSHLLHLDGIDSVVLELRSRAHVLERVRAGVLEAGTVKLLRDAGLGGRLDELGEHHSSFAVAFAGGRHVVELAELTGKPVTIYGQTAMTHDLYAARDAAGGVIIDEAEEVTPHDIESRAPHVTYRKDGETRRLDCDFIAGCDGFHGVARTALPASVARTFERDYPFGWIGLLSETPPVSETVMYVYHERGFALCSKRSASLSRSYVQCRADDGPQDWPDERFWDEFSGRLPKAVASRLVTGPAIEKSVAQIRSFVVEPMVHGRLFLAGDAAHIVPPTGAKGLNLAVSDVFYLHRALAGFYRSGSEEGLADYSRVALSRVWKAERFSWWMTRLLHQFPDEGPFTAKLQQAELDYLFSSRAARTAVAENYVGLPY